MILVVDCFNFSLAPRCSDYFQKRPSNTMLVTNFLLHIFGIYLTVRADAKWEFGETESTIYASIMLLICLARLKDSVFSNYFILPYSRSVSSFFALAEFNIIMSITIFNATQMSLVFKNMP